MSTDVLAERYGTASPWRRRALIGAAALVVLAFAGWLTWTVTDQTTSAVTSELETSTIVDEHTATAVVVVTLRSPDVRASCRLRAIAADHTVVGEWTFTPDGTGSLRHTVDFRTERRATAVESLGCTAPGQPRPR